MRVWEREIHFLTRTETISALGNQGEELLLQGVTLQKVQLLALEVRLVEGKQVYSKMPALREDSGLLGTKTAFLFLIPPKVS